MKYLTAALVVALILTKGNAVNAIQASPIQKAGVSVAAAPNGLDLESVERLRAAVTYRAEGVTNTLEPTQTAIQRISGAVYSERAASPSARTTGPCNTWHSWVRPSMSVEKVHRRVLHTIRCAFERFAPEYLNVALGVMSRESGAWPWARNPDSDSACHPWDDPLGSCGLFQHLARYWPGRVQAFLRRDWWPGVWPRVPIYDIRAQAIISAKMMRGQGGACPAWC